MTKISIRTELTKNLSDHEYFVLLLILSALSLKTELSVFFCIKTQTHPVTEEAKL